MTVSTTKTLRRVRERLSNNQRLRLKLPGGGCLHVDRQLPFLCVARTTEHPSITAEVAALITSQPSYLLIGEGDGEAATRRLVKAVVETLAPEFGTFLVLEVTAKSSTTTSGNMTGNDFDNAPFRIFSPRRKSLESMLEALRKGLEKFKLGKRQREVVLTLDNHSKPSSTPLMDGKSARALNCHRARLEIPPFFHDSEEDAFHPLTHKRFRRHFTRVIQRAVFAFTGENSIHKPKHYQSLGRRAFVKAVWNVDRRLAAIARQFDVLLLVTPTNVEAAWLTFKRRRYGKEPVFHYKPCPFDPALLKRELYDIPIEKVEDPTLAHIFTSKQTELSRQIDLIPARGTDNFTRFSVMLHGKPTPERLDVAKTILERPTRRPRSRGKYAQPPLTAEQVAELARKELTRYENVCGERLGEVEIRDDVSGIMVSNGTLLIGSSSEVAADHSNGLVQHEIGVHMLTCHNGQRTPFQLFSCGLNGYEELQEGLAVMAELAVDGLPAHRLRLLAARVLAVDLLLNGASFTETFRVLRDIDFSPKLAFMITMRVFRGGGHVKDHIYLNGFIKVMERLRTEARLENLFMGKFSFTHLPLIEELRNRQVLKAPLVMPFFLKETETKDILRRFGEVLPTETINPIGDQS